MKKISRLLIKLLVLTMLLFTSTISFGIKLDTIKGLSRLSNYKELKDI